MSDVAMIESFEMVEPPNENRVSLKLDVEKGQLAAGELHAIKGLVSLSTGQVDEDGRPPMEIVLVADRSGSMAGEKMRIMRVMMEFLVKRALRTGDKLGIVAFDSDVTVPLPMTELDGDGKGAAAAYAAIEGIHVGSTTNLSGGLLKGIDELNGTPSTPGATRAILLFTDGIANGGIREPSDVAEAIAGAMRGQRSKVFTFGFGDDAEEEMLKTIAETTEGQYYHVANEERIAHAFGDCVGGLLSVVAQNVTLTLSHYAQATLAKVHGSYPTKVDPASQTTVVELGDLYAEEKKNLLLDLTVPRLEAPVGSEDVLFASLTFFDAREHRRVTTSTTLRIARPETTPADQPVHLEIDEQINRLRLVDAMEQATGTADDGDVAAGRQLLQDAVAAVLRSPSGGGAAGGPPTPLVRAIVDDARRLDAGFESMAVYHARGGKASKSAAQALRVERSSTDSSHQYQNSSKASYIALAAEAAEAPKPPGLRRQTEHIAPPAPKRQAAAP
tara:strand:+ start:1 stop:1506 length:1506 start_codon:yes stop_codon:yes gene_type:complete